MWSPDYQINFEIDEIIKRWEKETWTKEVNDQVWQIIETDDLWEVDLSLLIAFLKFERDKSKWLEEKLKKLETQRKETIIEELTLVRWELSTILSTVKTAWSTENRTNKQWLIHELRDQLPLITMSVWRMHSLKWDDEWLSELLNAINVLVSAIRTISKTEIKKYLVIWTRDLNILNINLDRAFHSISKIIRKIISYLHNMWIDL